MGSIFSKFFLIFPILALLNLLACGQPPSHSEHKLKNVFGVDDRQDILSRGYPWSSIGGLDTGCTAALVGRRLALTAAHCVVDSASGAVREQVQFFYPNRVAGQSPDVVAIERIWFGSKEPDTERQGDWALLLLARPVGERFGYMDIAAVDVKGRLPFTVSLAGYSTDRNNGQSLSVHQGCAIRRVVLGGRHLHDCDAASGVSGGPVFLPQGSALTKSRAVVVGISVSEYRRGAADSVHRPNYDDLYANVAIAATNFHGPWQILRQSVDMDQPLGANPFAALASPVFSLEVGKATPSRLPRPTHERTRNNPRPFGDPDSTLQRIYAYGIERRDQILADKAQEVLTEGAALRQVIFSRQHPPAERQRALSDYTFSVQFFHGLALGFAERYRDPQLHVLLSQLAVELARFRDRAARG